jgi:hypothetical protein
MKFSSQADFLAASSWNSQASIDLNAIANSRY